MFGSSRRESSIGAGSRGRLKTLVGVIGLGAGLVGVWVLKRRWEQRRIAALPEPHGEPEVVESKPAVWQELDPDDLSDPVAHQAYLSLTGVDDWQLVGASQRGKMHAHQGSYREDAFAMDVVGCWHVLAVSDGAGSAQLSRVGSHLIVETAMTRLREILSAEPQPSDERLIQALDEALQAAHAAVQGEAEARELPVKAFSGTFLFLAHGLTPTGQVVAAMQVGDGLLAIQHADGTLESLAESDSGAFGGETYFLTSKPAEAWLGRGVVRHLQEPPMMLAAMSDGVADDFIPYDKHLPALYKNLGKVVAHKTANPESDAGQLLLQLISYDKRGSFDDRTLVMFYRKAA